MNFLIVLLAVVLLEAYADLGSVQRDGWLKKWFGWLGNSTFFDRQTHPSALRLLVFITVPVFGVYLVLDTLEQRHWGLLLFCLELLVLLYGMGRGNLDRQIELLRSDLQADDFQAAFHDAAGFNQAYREGKAETKQALSDEIFTALPYRMFERSFVVIFWFFLLGAPVALAYRLLALYGDLTLYGDPEKSTNNAYRPLWLLEWLPVRALGLTVGLMGNFSRTSGMMQAALFSKKVSSAEFLQRAVEGALSESNAPLDLNQQSLDAVVALFRRAMTTWLVVIAILVILG